MIEYGRDCRALFELVVATYYCGIGKEVKSFVGIILLSDWVKRLGRLAGVTPAKHVGPTFEAAFKEGNGRRLNQTRGFSPGLLGVWRFCSMTAGHYREQVSDKERTAWEQSGQNSCSGKRSGRWSWRFSDFCGVRYKGQMVQECQEPV